MALTVEDGTGLASAESYISVADALAYLTAVNNAATWTSKSAAEKEAALRRATQYLDTQYTWRGDPLTLTQALEWPRIITVDGRNYTWPVRQIREACAELAARALSGDLYADTGQTIEEEQIGPIRTRYRAGLSGAQTRFTAVDQMVAKFTTGGGRSFVRIERVS